MQFYRWKRRNSASNARFFFSVDYLCICHNWLIYLIFFYCHYIVSLVVFVCLYLLLAVVRRCQLNATDFGLTYCRWVCNCFQLSSSSISFNFLFCSCYCFVWMNYVHNSRECIYSWHSDWRIAIVWREKKEYDVLVERANSTYTIWM